MCACSHSKLVILAVHYILQGGKRVSAHFANLFLAIAFFAESLTGRVPLVSLVDWLLSLASVGKVSTADTYGLSGTAASWSDITSLDSGSDGLTNQKKRVKSLSFS